MNPSTRLKVRGDTFFLPGSDGSVYFRNNIGSFRMEGASINQWIEKLMPIFNGEHSMQEVTNGLSEPYQKRVYEIAEVLFANGYVRDVSSDQPHQLDESVQQKYASQIEFLDSFEGSGGYRFQLFRESTVLAVGSGSFFVSLVKALLEAGMPRIQLLVTHSEKTDRERIYELAERARLSDQQVRVDEILMPSEGNVDWKEAIQPFDAVFYVATAPEEIELKAIHQACREEKKVLLPAIILEQTGIAGPLVHPKSDGCWESAWRRIHQVAISRASVDHSVSSTAEALLANVVVFEWLKTSAEVIRPDLNNKLYLLNLETLEGSWHPFLTHPLANRIPAAAVIDDVEAIVESEDDERTANSKSLITYFSRLTSSETGIFHLWEEGELLQLPLSQCRVQIADPLSLGPSELRPEKIYNGLNHEEARTEAGLAGLESYVARLEEVLFETKSIGGSDALMQADHVFLGVGAGRSVAEGLSRALQKCLNQELIQSLKKQPVTISMVTLDVVEDGHIRFYLTSLNTLLEHPEIGFSDDALGFPVAWVGIKGNWYGAVDFNRTKALRRALQQVLLTIQNKKEAEVGSSLFLSSVHLIKAEAGSISITQDDTQTHRESLLTALQQLKRMNKKIITYDMAIEAFMKEEMAGVFGVSLREEEGL
ncbi:putative thiazole-containing bacteriocin maturation protein [Paenibacillus paridis]|uniref:putative thiazole-containing bacteriocin maturation protein n=1 Tax=Paenibacillus paridis TaxID=2583376 RepID=UPI00111DC707|nr:putative thiazole-containing bacteriocin maturation protein [Paenibacillus paridis]